jgi:hypothetical protein
LWATIVAKRIVASEVGLLCPLERGVIVAVARALRCRPTRTSPLSLKATIESVVRARSAFSITLAYCPSITATQELVVPRSMSIALAMTGVLVWLDSKRKVLPLQGNYA